MINPAAVEKAVAKTSAKEPGIEHYRQQGLVGCQNMSGSEVLWGDQQGDIIAPNHSKKNKE